MNDVRDSLEYIMISTRSPSSSMKLVSVKTALSLKSSIGKDIADIRGISRIRYECDKWTCIHTASATHGIDDHLNFHWFISIHMSIVMFH